MTESKFQQKLKKELETRFPGCVILKNDPSFIQGIPDLIILFGKKWAALECKRDAYSKHQPNQDYYVNKLNDNSFARFIYPKNKGEILDELERFFEG